MSKIKYFSDVLGDAIELVFVTAMNNKEFAENFPGVKGFRYDGYSMWVGHPTGYRPGLKGFLPVTRKIEYKAFPSLHDCNAKCVNGKHNGTCECRCSGKNHGVGIFTRLARDPQK